MSDDQAARLLDSRHRLVSDAGRGVAGARVAEGGCGVVGLASSRAVAGRYLKTACVRMHNRGNGKGGGIAASGLSAEQMKVSPEVLRECYMIQIAYLDPASRSRLEKRYLKPVYDIRHAYPCDPACDFRDIPGIEVRPPDVWRYFVRGKDRALEKFAGENGLETCGSRAVEDELVYQTSFRINRRFYSSLGDKQAFVLSHGRDLMIFKIVGHAEQVIEYYGLDDCLAHVWIAHQRYPTKGRVWHPGGAHPFIGMNEALVHNGDFANYHSISEYLMQRNYQPLFLTDTEVSVLLFDLYERIYCYPLEYICEALAPTTERDYLMLPPRKREVYRAIQWAHQHASPDGPWFFILARSHPEREQAELIGITDTSMLRPQVFAVQEQRFEDDSVFKIGLIASEKQAIDVVLENLSADDSRICPRADAYWNARGGSYTDGGAFIFTVTGTGENRLVDCTNKFGELVSFSPGDDWLSRNAETMPPDAGRSSLPPVDVRSLAFSFKDGDYHFINGKLDSLSCLAARSEEGFIRAVDDLTFLLDRPYDPGRNKPAWIKSMVSDRLAGLFRSVPRITDKKSGRRVRVGYDGRRALRSPAGPDSRLFIDAAGFSPEGRDSLARLVVACHEIGWRNMVVFGLEGQRFLGCGLGGGTGQTRIEVYGSSGDYLGSGLDGATMIVHGTAQDQVGQILKRGKLVIYGDVGQTLLYGAKGGDIFVMGSAAGRPLINAVGSPRAIINGTCLDYLAESFMAGDPLNGGGFAIVNGVFLDHRGTVREMDTPYPGGNLFSLASGGAVYIRDPHGKVEENQLNGGSFSALGTADWKLILPYLEENERLFGIPVDELLSVEGKHRQPAEVYRKVSV